jgi:hypothetical protein
MENVQEEKVFHKDSNVTVTQSRFIANGRTYAMRNISSVTIFEIEKSKKLPIAILIVGCIMAFCGGDTMLLGIVIAIGGLIWILMLKNDYAVRISTNAGETNSLTSGNKDYIQKVVNALNDAIIYRG